MRHDASYLLTHNPQLLTLLPFPALLACPPRAVTACTALANILKTSLGPVGLDKMMVRGDSGRGGDNVVAKSVVEVVGREKSVHVG